ncbi:MAG: CHASE3 domain-containing protein, partial [Burkholderiales bacterium]|nr:CHASE3 domain-containing protein [Burkholderiales bacterium]
MKLLPLLRGSRFAFPLAALVALAFFMISESSYQQATATFAELGTEGTARTTIQVLWRSLTDAETGQRGYLLTGRKEYLKPYTEAQTQVAQSLDWLNRYYGTDPATAGLMKQVTLASRDKLSELAETMKLYDEGKEESWRALVLSDIGKEQMDTVRSQSEQLLAIESTRLAAARKSLAQTLLLNRIGVTAMTALSLLALFMYLRQTTVVVRQREEQRRIVQAERDLLEREVVRRTEQLTELTRHLQTVREDERNHLARELHDELGALLTAAKLDVARLKSRLGALAPEVAERLQHLNDGLNSGIALKRRIIEDLRPSSLSNLGLVAALEILVREWAQNTEIAVRSALEPVRLRPSGELTVYRLVQEALTNISKYARASQVAVELSS